MKKFKNLKRESSLTLPAARAALNLGVSNTPFLTPDPDILLPSVQSGFDFKKNILYRPGSKIIKFKDDMLYFSNPSATPVCRSRKDRRRSLFAAGLAGKIKIKKAKWSDRSFLKC